MPDFNEDLEVLEMLIDDDYNQTRHVRYPYDSALDKPEELEQLSGPVDTYNIRDREGDE